MINSTVAAVATPSGAGGLGVIRISGPDAIAVADRCFRAASGKPLGSLPGYRAAFGYVTDGENDIDEAVALVFRAPKSYTGEDVAELSCHGGMYVVQRTLRAVLAAGAEPAPAGEFTKRAFLNGKTDLARAEGVMNIISAGGEQALAAARGVQTGSLSRKIHAVAASLTASAAAMAAWADYPEEDIPALEPGRLEKELEDCRAELERLLAGFDAGQAMLAGVPTAICGKPNVGKSTLMNLLSGTERSIVTSVAGTTRDIVEQTVRLGDVQLLLADTAGLRETQDEVESIGVRRAREKMDTATLLIAVFDSTEKPDDEDRRLLEYCRGRRAVAVINKTDIGQFAPGQGAHEQSAHEQSAHGRDAPGQSAHEQSAPGRDTPGRDAHGQSAHEQSAPGQFAPGRDTPGRDAHGQFAPGRDAPGQDAPGRDAPGQSAHEQSAPGQFASVQLAPGRDTPGQDAPGQSAHEQSAHEQSAPGQFASVQLALEQFAPGRDAPGQGALGRAFATEIRNYIPDCVEFSAKDGTGYDKLSAVISRLLGTAELDTGAPMLTTERQRQCCVAARENISEALCALRGGMTLDAVNVNIDCAIDALLSLTGERARENVVNEVFARFCVGK